MSVAEIRPFESFSVVYKVLIWAGFYKLSNKPENKIKWICHQIYRPLVFTLIFVFNLQHIAFMILRHENMENVFDALIIEVPQLNLVMKFLTVNLQIPRIEKINELLKDRIFGAYTKEDEALLLMNKRAMHRLTKFILTMVALAATIWPASHFVRRYNDETAVVPSYVPFATDTWGKFSISVALEVLPMFWIGLAHIALDCLVSTYYAQAEVQLKIIKHNLQHLFDISDVDASETSFQFRDEIDADLKGRFVYCVQRFEKLAWYTKEINAVFNPAMSFQFFTSSLTMCMVVYTMSSTPVGSVPFIFLTVLVVVFSTQVFLYCYFGNSVHYESQSVVNSLYLSEWLSVSPKFRRLLLIAMLRWSRSLSFTVSGVIPLSINTFVSILRSTYSLYAVLTTRKS